MRNTSKDPSTVPFIAPYVGAMDWADAWARAAEGWFEWNQAVWQQLIDVQAGYLRPWSEQSGWPMLPFFLPRGGEQLA
jgi:hypothetical protein